MPSWFHFIALGALGLAVFTKATQRSWICDKAWLLFVFLSGTILMVYASREGSVLIGYAIMFPLLAQNWLKTTTDDQRIQAALTQSDQQHASRTDSSRP